MVLKAKDWILEKKISEEIIKLGEKNNYIFIDKEILFEAAINDMIICEPEEEGKTIIKLKYKDLGCITSCGAIFPPHHDASRVLIAYIDTELLNQFETKLNLFQFIFKFRLYKNK